MKTNKMTALMLLVSDGDFDMQELKSHSDVDPSDYVITFRRGKTANSHYYPRDWDVVIDWLQTFNYVGANVYVD